MSTIKANTISPIGSTLTLGAPVAGLSVASGITVGGIGYFSSGVSFASTTDTAGVARFASGVTFSGTIDCVGVARFESGVTLSSTLTVGNFGAQTNIMAKPTMAVGVGQVVPIATWNSSVTPPSATSAHGNNTLPLPTGRWFVYFVGTPEYAHSTSQSENPTMTMAQVWNVPANQWLVFAHSATVGAASTDSIAGVCYKFVNSTEKATILASGTAYTNINSANGWNELSVSNGIAESTIYAGKSDPTTTPSKGVLYHSQPAGQPTYMGVPITLNGFAIKIA